MICYSEKHPAGPAPGWNVIYIGDNEAGEQLFLGHGFKRAMTEKEILLHMFKLYNQERSEADLAYIRDYKGKDKAKFSRESNTDLRKHYTIDKYDDKHMGGFRPRSVKRLDPSSAILAKQELDGSLVAGKVMKQK